MKKITEIYEEYKIQPTLEEHMLRVSGVTKWILDNWRGVELDKNKILTVALLHDMGNILKFDFSPEVSPFIYTDEERKYWEEIKKEYQEKYGNQVHEATKKIVEELELPVEISEKVGGLGFRQSEKFLENMDYISMIVQYADMRVTPHTITSIDERLKDFYRRYEKRSDFEILFQEREDSRLALYEIQKIILKNTNENLLEISDKIIQPLVEELKNFEI